MVRSLAVAVMLLVASSSAWAQVGGYEAPPPCEGVSCSGHGRCLVIRGEPACACDEDYTTDATGLNCVRQPVAETPAPAPEPEAAPVAETQPEASGSQEQRVVVVDTGATIPRRDLEGFNLWLPGIIIEILGGAALVAGAVLAANDSETLRWTGVGLAIGGGTFMVGGLVMALIGGLRMRRDRARQLTEQLNARLVPLLRATDGGGMVGLAGRF